MAAGTKRQEMLPLAANEGDEQTLKTKGRDSKASRGFKNR